MEVGQEGGVSDVKTQSLSIYFHPKKINIAVHSGANQYPLSLFTVR